MNEIKNPEKFTSFIQALEEYLTGKQVLITPEEYYEYCERMKNQRNQNYLCEVIIDIYKKY